MSVSTTRFLLQFNATGLSSLITARSTIKGISQQSYTSFNEASRSYSNLERNMMRSSNNISRSLNGVLGIMRGFVGFNIGMSVLGGMVNVAEKMQRAFISTNSTLLTSKIIIEELLGKGKAQGFLETIQTKSAVYGVSLTESMNSSKALVEAMKMVSKKKEVRPDQLGKLLNMTYALNMMDTENRGVNYTAFSIKEMMGGQGRIDFRSLRQRLNVNLGAKQEQEIAKAFKQGDLDKGINMFSDALKRIGIDADKLLERLSAEGWTQNISKLQGYVSMAFQRIGESAFLSLIKPLRGVNDFLGRQFKEGSRGGGIFREIGSSMEAFIKPSIEYLQQFGHELWKNREIAVSFFRSMSGSMINGAVSFAQIFTSFGKGLSGQKNSDGVHERVQGILGLMKTMERFGESAGKFFNSLIDPVNRLGLSINSLVSELVKLGTGHTGGAGAGGLVGGLMNLASVGANAGAGAIGGVNSVLGNNGNASTGIMDKLQAGGNYLLTAGMLYSMFRFKNRGASTGTTGSGAMGTSGQALANEERMIAQNGNLQSYEEKYRMNQRMRDANVLSTKTTLDLKNISDKIKSRSNSVNPHTTAINNLDAHDNVLASLQKKNMRERSKLNQDFFNTSKSKEERDQILLKINALDKEQVKLKNERKRNDEKISQQLINEKDYDVIRQKDVIELKNKQKILLDQNIKNVANEQVEQSRMGIREKYFTSENINTALNATMTAGMVGQMVGSRGAGAVAGASTGLMARIGMALGSNVTRAGLVAGTGSATGGMLATSLMPTIASWGSIIATGFMTGVGLPITVAITAGLAGFYMGGGFQKAMDLWNNKGQESEDSIRNSEADINLSKANTRRQIAQRNFFQMNGIDPAKMTALLQNTAGGYEMSARYSQSSPENKKAMQAMNDAYKNGTFSPSELRSKYGDGGADAIMKMDEIMIGGNLSIESMNPKLQKELTDMIYDKLKHRGAIPIKGAGVEGVFYTVDTEEQKANKWKFGAGVEGTSGTIPVK
jgi:hypothetical protein